MKEKELVFEEISEGDMLREYTADCSGGVSDCCTRVCTRNHIGASEEDWCRFLAADGGMIQY